MDRLVLSKTIRDLRTRLLHDLGQSLRQTYKLGIEDVNEAKLDAAAAMRRARLQRFGGELDDVVKQAAYTLLNRLIYLRLLEAAKLRKTAVLTGGWRSPGYRDFRALAPDLLGDDSEGYALLLRAVFDDLALDLPGLYGRSGLADLVPIPHETLRYVVEQLDQPWLASHWTDDMTLGWVYQYWNDPEREAIDAKLNAGGKVEPHELASKTQLFTERYMVDWLLQNSLGPMWLAMCKRNGWTALCERNGTLARLEQRRIDWRAKREAGEVSLTDMMPLDTDEESRWAYYVPQAIPDDAVALAPESVRALRLMDPAVGSGHFLVVAFDLLVALYHEEAQHRGETWSDAEIVESILTNNLYGIDLDPRAVQIAAAALWLKAQQIAPGAWSQTMNLVSSDDHLGSLRKDGGSRVLQEGTYDLVVGNPPYQSTSRMANSAYIEQEYPRGKADLFAAFLQRGLELVRPGGVSALLTMRSWMFLKQYAQLRLWLLENHDLRLLHDMGSGAFEEISPAQVVVSVVTSVFRRAPMSSQPARALKVFEDETVTTLGESKRKRAATLCQQGQYDFELAALEVVPERPLVYWWGPAELSLYRTYTTFGTLAGALQGISTANNLRFLRLPFEVPKQDITIETAPISRKDISTKWVAYIKGAAGVRWIEPLSFILRWELHGAAIQESRGSAWRNDDAYYRLGVSFPRVGQSFSARLHRYASMFDAEGPTLLGVDPDEAVCVLNSAIAKSLMLALNPTIHFTQGDIARLPVVPVAGAAAIVRELKSAFAIHESHREASVEFQHPGPSPWQHAQAWAQRAVDRPENAPLPEYTEQLTPEPNTDHISFALGVALGRFGSPDSDELPDGILFLDGTLESEGDGLGHPATARLRETWQTHPPEGQKRADLREYLRLDFFSDVHRKMYENRPIYWPLSSERKTFVAWINSHRWHVGTLRSLLANHLNPTKRRIESQLDELREASRSTDVKLARAAEKQLPKLEKLDAELAQFIADVSQCGEHGPPPADAKSPERERDAVYDPDLDDGVMINSAALWPLLLPQWKDPKRWWKELCDAKGRKDYDWSHLAARYFPDRVDEKCRRDASLSISHGCFWKYHPARALEWEQRLQDEISPDFTIDC